MLHSYCHWLTDSLILSLHKCGGTTQYRTTVIHVSTLIKAFDLSFQKKSKNLNFSMSFKIAAFKDGGRFTPVHWASTLVSGV